MPLMNHVLRKPTSTMLDDCSLQSRYLGIIESKNAHASAAANSGILSSSSTVTSRVGGNDSLSRTKGTGSLNPHRDSETEGTFGLANDKCCKLLKFMLADWYKARSPILPDFGTNRVIAIHIGK